MSDQPGLRLVPITANRPGTVRLDGVVQPTITEALASARSGSTVEVGRGRYSGATESFPLRVPGGVTLRGPEPPDIPDAAKKFLPTPPPAELVTDGCVVEITGDAVTVAHLKLTNRRPGTVPTVSLADATSAALDTCEVSGSIEVTRSLECAIRWSTIDHGRLVGHAVEDLWVTGGTFTGTHGSEPLVELTDCTRARIEATAMPDAGAGVTARGCAGLLIGGCAILADGDAVRVVDSTRVMVNGNRLRGATAVHLIGCDDGEISANGVERADTAIHLERCTGIEIGFNHIAEAQTELRHTPVEDSPDR